MCSVFSIGYPVVTLGFGFKSYVGYRMRQRRQREVQKENEYYYQFLREALPPGVREDAFNPHPSPKPCKYIFKQHSNNAALNVSHMPFCSIKWSNQSWHITIYHPPNTNSAFIKVLISIQTINSKLLKVTFSVVTNALFQTYGTL